MKNVNTITGVTISASMILSATSAIAQVKGGDSIQIDDNFSVSDEVMNNIDVALQKKDVTSAVSAAFDSIVTKFKDDDATLAERYFSEYITTEQNVGIQVAQRLGAATTESTDIAACGITCYSNCYSACHGACHASRGWR